MLRMPEDEGDVAENEVEEDDVAEEEVMWRIMKSRRIRMRMRMCCAEDKVEDGKVEERRTGPKKHE